MPIPQIIFSKNSSAEERGAALKKMEDWSNSAEVSVMKKELLKSVLGYAQKNLVNISFITFNREKYQSGNYEVCDSIFRHADLPDLLFIQHIINQIHQYKINNNDLKDTVLPSVLNNKNILMVPRIHKTRKACVYLALFSLVTRFRPGILFGGIGIILSEQIEEWRVEKSLENKLALKTTHGMVARVEDGYDDMTDVMTKLTKTGYNFANHLFYKLPLPAFFKDDEKSSNPVEQRQSLR